MSQLDPPPMDSERWSRVRDLFHRCMDVPAVDRGPLLESQCGDDKDLILLVERLIAADTYDDAVIDGPLEDAARTLLPASEAPVIEMPALESRVGRYKLLEVLGTGGMGQVFRAERADGAYDQEVALKVVHTHRVGEEAARRLRAERQILARLDHPGIAKLLDGGLTENGLPYFAMELISGTTLTDHCRTHALTTAARVQLMLQVIDAVDFAHRNLVVHRDLKPSNILVNESGSAKLLDFGIARLLDQEGNDPVTRTGLSLLTPEYAAPEQIRGEPVTTSADIYALGAILYELLSGRRPFEHVGGGWNGLRHVLNEEPPPLSKVEGLDRRDRRVLEGDLTTIVAKAMEKDPGRRYRSTEALRDDLTRYLEGRPVKARPPSVAYLITKFLRRNPVASALGVATVSAILLGTGGTLWQAREAQQEAERAQAVSDFLFSLFDGADPDLHPGGPMSAADLLESGLGRIDGLEVDAELRVDLLTTMGTLFGKLGHADRAETLLREAVAEASAELGARHLTTGRAMDALGTRLGMTGDPEEGVSLLQQALVLRRSAGAAPMEIGTTQGNLARAQVNAGKLDDAIESYRGAIADLNRATNGDSLAFASELMGLAQAYEVQERFPEADSLMRTVLRLREGEGDSPAHAIALHNHGHLLSAWKDDADRAVARHTAALEMWRRMFPDGHPEVPRSMEQVARIVELRGEWDRADSLYSESIRLWSDLYGLDHPHLAAIRANQANLRYRRGQLEAAADAYRDIVRIYRTAGEVGLLAVSVHNLGVINREMGRYDQAESLIREGLELRMGYLEAPHTAIALSLTSLAGLGNLQGRWEKAEALAREGLSQYEAVLPQGHSAIEGPRLELGIALAGQRRWAEARSPLETARQVFVETLNPADGLRGRSALWLGIVLDAMGEARGMALVEEALPVLEQAFPSDNPEVLRARRSLGVGR